MRKYLGQTFVVALICVLAGCQKPVPPQQAAGDGSGSAEQAAVQPASELAEGTDSAQQAGAHANKSGEAAPVLTVLNADGQMVCGPTILAPEDADKWDCVPDIGYWCTAPGGCPVNGNIAMPGTRLVYALPVPQGSGFRFEHPAGNLVPWKSEDAAGVSFDVRWECASEDGCPCGSGRVAKWGECLGDTYRVRASDNGKCQDKVCDGFCRNGQCVCGDEVIAENVDASLACKDAVMFCMNKNGCIHKGKKYAQNEGWIDFELQCENEEGCACGSAKCTQDEKCIPSENKCIKPPGTQDALVIPDGYRRKYYDDELECINEEGCVCGSVVCPKEFVCRNDVCFRVDTTDNGDEYSYYCNKAKGCPCGISVCPKGGFCHDVKYHDGTGWEVSCVKFERQFENESEAVQYMDSSEFYCSFLNAFDEEDMEILKKRNVLYEEENIRGKITRNGKLVEKEFHAEPGRVCGATPLMKGYLCYESHVLFDRKDNVTPWSTCDESPYINIDDQCVIAEEFFEQICNDKKGCDCGTEKIVKGDICVDGHAQCSTKKPRPGCLCGDSKLEKGFVCYKGQQVCQGVIKKDTNEDEDTDTEKVDTSCACNGQTIHLGDICLKDKVICGADATETPGCLCGEKALREGYRCFLEKQLCACKSEGEEACTCKCGEQDIQKDVECGKDDVPIIPKGAEIKENEDGSYTLNCDGNEVRLKEPYYSMHVGDYNLRLEDPEDQRLLCTCGTGKPVPGKGYGCGFTPGTVGYGSEFMGIAEPQGYQCQDFNGCKCGLETCNPGDICRVENDGSQKCEKFLTFDGECNDHVLPATKVSAWGYGCYGDHGADMAAVGWYCMNADGCACGDVTCEQWQMCLTPGICSRNKIPESKYNHVIKPEIEVCEDL